MRSGCDQDVTWWSGARGINLAVFVHMEHYIIITMVTGECKWSDLPVFKSMMTGCQSLFPAFCGSPLAEVSCTVLGVTPSELCVLHAYHMYTTLPYI